MLRTISRSGASSRRVFPTFGVQAAPVLFTSSYGSARAFSSFPFGRNTTANSNNSSNVGVNSAFDFARRAQTPVTGGGSVFNKSSSSTGGSSIRRPTPAPSKAEPKLAEDGEEGASVQQIDLGVIQAKDDVIDRAFERFSSEVGGCSKEEFLKGTQEMYYNLASLNGYLAEAVPEGKFNSSLKMEHVLVNLSSKQLVEMMEKDFQFGRSDLGEKATNKNSEIMSFWNAMKSYNLKKTNKKNKGASSAAASTYPGKTPFSLLNSFSGVPPKNNNSSGSTNDTNSNSAVAPSKKEEFNPEAIFSGMDAAISKAVAAITWLVPMSGHLAETIFKTFVNQKKRDGNLFGIAAPNDYILSPKLSVFVPFNGANIYIDNNLPESMNISFAVEFLASLDARRARGDYGRPGAAPPASGDSNTTTTTTSATKENALEVDPKKEEGVEYTQSHSFAIHKDGSATVIEGKIEKPTDEKELKANNTATNTTDEAVADKTTAETVHKVAAPEAEMDEDELISVSFTINDIEVPPVPANAKAAAIVSFDVVVPPQRYLPAFDWFYKRVVSSSSEFERVAVARIFAETIPRQLYTGLDFIGRMFSGNSLQFRCTPATKEMMGVPAKIDQQAPVTRKLLVLYMDSSYKWIISDLFCSTPGYSELRDTNTVTPSK